MSNKIYLDCTHTYNSGLNTGIQRVVKNVVKNIPLVEKDLKVRIIPVVSISNQYYSFRDFPVINQNNNTIKKYLKKIYINLRTFFMSILPAKYHEILFSPGIAIFLNKSVDKILFAKKIKAQKLEILKDSDILILIDTTWLNTNYKQLKKLKEQNVKVVAVIYDIIPLLYPNFCTIDLTLSLKEWYKNATKYIDSYIAISKTVKEDIFKYIKENIEQNISEEKFDYFYLGADIHTNSSLNRVSSEVKELFKSSNIYITVSTIEPRKNHSYILDTFDKLWDSNTDITYVIIGRIGWKSESLIRRIKQHKQYGKKLFWLRGANDDELIYAYKNSKALIFASFTEGFGLPIIESMFYKLPVLASDISIHREVGSDKVSYFNLSDSNSLYGIILSNHKLVQPKSDFNWQTWQESTKDLILKSRDL